jgi:hypothetical protein
MKGVITDALKVLIFRMGYFGFIGLVLRRDFARERTCGFSSLLNF